MTGAEALKKRLTELGIKDPELGEAVYPNHNGASYKCPRGHAIEVLDVGPSWVNVYPFDPEPGDVFGMELSNPALEKWVR